MAASDQQPRIYLVEDSPIMVRLLQELLLGIGASVVGHSKDSSIAVSEISALRPDAIIVDISLPGGDGVAVLKAFAGNRKYDGLTRIVLTNYVSEPYQRAAARLGVDYFFDKSIDIPKMLQVIASIAIGVGRHKNGSAP